MAIQIDLFINIHTNSVYQASNVWVCCKGHPLLSGHGSCTTNVYKLEAYAFTGSILDDGSMHLECVVPAYQFAVFYEMFTSLNLANQDITCTECNHQ